MNNNVTKFVRAMLMSALVFTTIISIAGRGNSLAERPNALHAWAGALLLVITGLHTVSNRKWIQAVFAKPAAFLSRRLQWLRRVNLALLLLWAANAASTIVMFFHQDGAIPHQLAHLHHISGELFIFAIGFHMLLHWKWLVDVVGKLNRPKGKPVGHKLERPSS